MAVSESARLRLSGGVSRPVGGPSRCAAIWDHARTDVRTRKTTAGESAHDVLAAEAFAVPARDPSLGARPGGAARRPHRDRRAARHPRRRGVRDAGGSARSRAARFASSALAARALSWPRSRSPSDGGAAAALLAGPPVALSTQVLALSWSERVTHVSTRVVETLAGPWIDLARVRVTSHIDGDSVRGPDATAGAAGRRRQHGVVARTAAVGARVSSRAAGPGSRRYRAASLHRIHRGRRTPSAHGKLSLKGLWMAAVLACGPGALLSHRAGAGAAGI